MAFSRASYAPRRLRCLYLERCYSPMSSQLQPKLSSTFSDDIQWTALASSKRTFISLPRTFPTKTRSFLQYQDALRLKDGLPRGIELVYLLPKYHSMYLEVSDRIWIVALVAVLAFTPCFIVWRQFSFDEDQIEDNIEYVYDEHGARWKRKKIGSVNLNSMLIENKIFSYFWISSFSLLFLGLRIDSARTPLRIYYHPSLLRYYAVFPRHWKKNRVNTFAKNRVMLRHGKFLILKPEGSHYTLPNKVWRRHFRDEEHTDVFVKKKKK